MRGNTLTRSIALCFLIMFTLVILCSFGSAQAATAPVIQSLDKNIVSIGDWVWLTGTGLGSAQGSSYVSFGPFPSSAYGVWNDTQIQCQIPALPGVTLPVTGPVTVTTPDGTSNAVSITVRKTPVVAAIWPPLGFAGAVIDAWIFGSGFQQGATVSFNGGMIGWGGVGVSNVTVVSDSIITCRLGLPTRDPNVWPPYFAVGFNVYVVNPDGGISTGNVAFNVTENPSCGGGAGVSIGMVGLIMGTLSLAGTLGIRRRRRKQA